MTAETTEQQIKRLSNDDPRWHIYVKRFALACAVGFLLSLFIPWMQTLPAEGRVVALDAQERRQELSSPVDGRVQKWFVKEGDKVKQGDPLVEISDNDPQILTRMALEREALDKKFNATELARQTAALNVKRQKQLFDEGLSSRLQYEKAKMELAKFESEEAAALADMSRIDVRLSRQAQQLVKAPADGTIVRIIQNALMGADYVHAGDPLAVIVPEGESRIIELWVSGNDMPWVEKGNRVAVQFEGWPSIFFSGVPGVSVGTFHGRVLLVDALDDGYGNFRVLVEPESDSKWPSPEHLRQGVRAFGTVLIGEVPLIYEVWRQFNGFPPSKLPVYQREDMQKKAKKKSDDKSAGVDSAPKAKL